LEVIKGSIRMKRFDLVNEVVQSPIYTKGNALLISNIGYCSRELFSVSDKPNNFYMLGSMGLASSIGLGLSLLQRRREVIVIDGDASVLMNLGTLATIASSAPRNFHLFVADNHVHGSTGGQHSHTAGCTDLFQVAMGAGIRRAERIGTKKELSSLFEGKRSLPTFILVDCEAGNKSADIVSLRESVIKERFMRFANNALL